MEEERVKAAACKALMVKTREELLGQLEKGLEQ